VKVLDIMTKKVVTTQEDATLASLRAIFSQAKFQHVPVVDPVGRIIGIVSVKDYFKAVSPVADSASEHSLQLFLQTKKVRQIMTSPVIHISVQTSVMQAAALLIQHNISALVVVDGQLRVLGIVSWKDILRVIVQAQQKKQTQRTAEQRRQREGEEE